MKGVLKFDQLGLIGKDCTCVPVFISNLPQRVRHLEI